MSRSSEFSYELARAQRQAIYNAQVSARVEEFYQRYQSQYEEMERKHYSAYIPNEMRQLEADLRRIRDLLVSDPTQAREISFQVGSYIRGMHSLGRAAISQFERGERMRQEAERERQQARQKALMKQYYDKVATISPATVHFAQADLGEIRSAIQSGAIAGGELQRRLSAAINTAEEKAAKWKQEKLAAGKQETAISRLEEMESSIGRSAMEDRKQADELIQRVRRMKEDIRAGRMDTETVEQEIASVETSVDDALVTEETRRQTVRAFIKLLRQQDFTVGKPVLVKEGSESYVKFTAQRPSGNRAVCRFDSYGKVRYKFDQYEGMGCLKDIRAVQADLERIYSVKLSDERVLWENPDRLTRDATGFLTAAIPQGGNDMAQKEYDIWLDRFQREIGFKSSVILYGNTSDIMMNQANQGRYEPIMQSVLASIRSKGYKNVVLWDQIDGISQDSNAPALAMETQPAADTAAYDLGDDNDEFTSGQSAGQAQYKDPGQFFPYLLNMLSNGISSTAFVLDYSDYIFGNPNSLSERERSYLTALGKALQQGQSYNMMSDAFVNVGNLVVIVAHNSGSIPPAYYQDNPLVSSINVPLPGRNERERFVRDNLSCLRVSQDLMRDKTRMDDFIDALDGLTLREIAQIMKLSRQVDGDPIGFERLINLFRYGEKTSPWEELSRDKLTEIEERLGKRVKGQDEAIEKVRDVIIRAYTGFSGLQHSSKQRKPKGTLFFVGPTGVGKTELAKSLAEFVFGDESACIRFDMSEYNHEHSDQRLVGAPPGYVGYEAGGQLTNAVKARPFCVLLFDEIEKAHGKILDKFLQILEDGRLTDGKGETVSFSETIIIFTSNIGAAKVDSSLAPAEARKQFIQAVQEHFVTNLQRPELLNRIGDNIVAFNFIDNPQIFTQIARSKFQSVEEFVWERYQATLSFVDEDTAFMAIAKKSGKANGGRGMLNRMESAIIDPLSTFIFERMDILAGRRIEISLVDERHLLYNFDLI